MWRQRCAMSCTSLGTPSGLRPRKVQPRRDYSRVGDGMKVIRAGRSCVCAVGVRARSPHVPCTHKWLLSTNHPPRCMEHAMPTCELASCAVPSCRRGLDHGVHVQVLATHLQSSRSSIRLSSSTNVLMMSYRGSVSSRCRPAGGAGEGRPSVERTAAGTLQVGERSAPFGVIAC